MTDTSPRPSASRTRRSTPRRSISLAPDLLADTPASPPPADEPAPAAKKSRTRKPTAGATAPEPPAPEAKPKPTSRAKTSTITKPTAAKAKSAAATPAPAAETANPAPTTTGTPAKLNPDAKPGEEYPGEPVMKLTVNVPESLHRRASGVVAHAQYTGTPEGIRSLTDLLRDALHDAVTDMEKRYNEGEPFRAPAALRRGRRPTLY